VAGSWLVWAIWAGLGSIGFCRLFGTRACFGPRCNSLVPQATINPYGIVLVTIIIEVFIYRLFGTIHMGMSGQIVGMA